MNSLLLVLALAGSLTTFVNCFLAAQPRGVWLGQISNRDSQQLLAAVTTYAPEFKELFANELAAELAIEVQSYVKIPFVPSPVIEYVLTEALKRLSTDLSPDLIRMVNELLATSATPSSFDNLPKEDIDALAVQVAHHLNPFIDVPVLDEEQEVYVLQEIFKVVFSFLTTSDATRRRQMLEAGVKGGRELLGTDESRRELVRTINKAVDIPLLDEGQEEALLFAAVQSCADTIQSLLPPELIQTLKGERPESVADMKAFLIDKVNAKVGLIALNEAQERVLIEAMVDILIDQYLDGTEMEFLVLSPAEQSKKLQKKITLLEREIQISKERHEREQQNLKAQLDRFRSRLKELATEA
jgi:hypothetical protein